MPLADESQRHLGVQVLVAGLLGVEARVGVERDRVLEADLHAAEHLGQLVEPVQVDLGEVVDVHPGEGLHRGHRGRPARLVALEGHLVLAHLRVLLADLGLLLGEGVSVGLVDLARVLPVVGLRERDPVVARNREPDRLLAAGRDVDQDQGVRGVPADALVQDALSAPGVQGVQDVVRQDVAVPVGAAFQSHQQDVLRADGRAAVDRVRAADAAHVAHDKVGKTAHRQDQGSGHAAQGISGLTGSAPQRGRRARPNHGTFPQQSQLWIVTVR